MEGITESALLSFFGGQCLHRLQVEVVVKMQVGQVFAVNQQVQHVVALSAHLDACFNPVELCILEELRGLKSLEQAPFLLCWRSLMME